MRLSALGSHLFVGVAVVTAAALGACDSAPRRQPGPGGTGQGVDLGGGGAGDGFTPIDPGGTGPDPTCSEEKFVPERTGDPDITLIMDTSGSMSEGTPPKYDQTERAISNVVSQLEAQMSPIHWGLILFPSDGNCGVSNTPTVSVGPGNAGAIVRAIGAVSPRGNTPLTKAVNTAVAHYNNLKDGRAHNLLVATDGEPNCDGEGLPRTCQNNAQCDPGQICQLLPLIGGICVDSTGGPAVQAIAAARAKGIRTYVVGISLGGTSNTLNKMAEEGGTARAGNTKYFPVNDQASLEAALKNIATQVISCSFVLKSLPTARQQIVVFVDGKMISRDANHRDGWDFDPVTRTLTFYGRACTELQNKPDVVTVGFTCPPPG